MVPKYNTMYTSILKFMLDGKERKLKEIVDYVAKDMKVSDKGRTELLKSGISKFYNNVGWAVTYLKKAELLESPSKGSHKLSKEGQKLLKTTKPEAIGIEYLKKNPNFLSFWVGNTNGVGAAEQKNVEDATPTARMEEAFRQINNALADELLEEIMKQDPWFFETLVVKLLVAMGYGGANPDAGVGTQKSGDEGIDGIIKEDKLGLSKIYIQAKRWEPSKTIGRPDIQTFVGALMGHGVSKGVYITTAHFSTQAKEYAAKQHSASIVLIDGQELTRLMIEFNLGVATEVSYTIKRIDSDFFNMEM